MNETKSIDWISGFITKNKSQIQVISIGYPSSDTIKVYMKDETSYEFWIKETSPLTQLFGTQIPLDIHRRFNWIDILLIHLRCGMKPPQIYVKMYYDTIPIFIKDESRRDPVIFLKQLQLKDYSVELNELLLNFIMSNPQLIRDTMLDCLDNYISWIMNDALKWTMVRKFDNPEDGVIPIPEIIATSKENIDLFISGLVDMRELIIKKRLEHLISDEEVSPELKMFFIRWNMEHFGSSGENGTLRL